MEKIGWKVLGLLAFVMLGLFFWEVIPVYAYFALPIWGIGVLVWFRWFLIWLRPRAPRLARALQLTAAIVLSAGVIFFCVVEGIILSRSRGAEEPGCDYVVVLGAAVKGDRPSRSLAERLTAACAYLEAYPEARCIVSGGQGWNESITEAECMAAWLTEQGVDPQRILLEDQAASTWENLCFSLDLIEKETGKRPEQLAVISSEYHLCRAGMMGRGLGVEILGYPAVTHPWLNRVHYYFREFFGVVHYWVLGN